MKNHIIIPLVIVIVVFAVAGTAWEQWRGDKPTDFTPWSDWSNYTSGLKDSAEVLVIVVGGIWTYRLFIRTRKDYAFPDLEVRITHRVLGNGKIYLSVIAEVKNASKVLLTLTSGKVYVQQVQPLFQKMSDHIQNADETVLSEGLRTTSEGKELFQADGEMNWYEQGYREITWGEDRRVYIEPSETAEIPADFLLDNSIETVKIIVYFPNPRTSGTAVGWRSTTIYDLKDNSEEKKR